MADIDIADVRELLTALREALTVPRAASYEHLDAQNQLIVDRATALKGLLAWAIKESNGLSTLRQQADIVRSVIADGVPVTYPVWESAASSGETR